MTCCSECFPSKSGKFRFFSSGLASARLSLLNIHMSVFVTFLCSTFFSFLHHLYLFFFFLRATENSYSWYVRANQYMVYPGSLIFNSSRITSEFVSRNFARWIRIRGPKLLNPSPGGHHPGGVPQKGINKAIQDFSDVACYRGCLKTKI